MCRPVYDVEPHTQFNGRVEEHAMAVSRIGFIDSGINFTSISVPVGMTENGLPVGEMLIAREGDLCVSCNQGQAWPCGAVSSVKFALRQYESAGFHPPAHTRDPETVPVLRAV